MKAIIMAGGFGTRLRPLTINIPKPMAPIGNLPIMEHVVSLLKSHNITDITSVLYFQADKIKEYFQDGTRFGVEMKYVRPDDDFGTAGAVRIALENSDEPVMIISGDVVTDFNLSEAIDWHNDKKADATILLTRIENPLAYGIVITGTDGKIERFLEKPSWGEAFSDTINTGIYILEPNAINMIPMKQNFDFSQDLYPAMLNKKMGLYGKIMKGYWRDVGNIDEYQKVHVDLFDQTLKLDSKSKQKSKGDKLLVTGKNSKIGKNVEISGTVVLGEDVVVEDKCRLHNCVIGDRTIIGEESNLKDTVIWADNFIGSRCKFNSAVVCYRCRIEDNVQLLDKVIVSDDCLIGNSATIRANCKIWPGKIIDEKAIVSTSMVWGEKWNRELFTNAKITGLALTEITPEMAVSIGAAFGAYLPDDSEVIISRDASDTSRLIKRALIAGLLASGADVADIESLPVPIVRFCLRSGNYSAGIYIRHNPDNYRLLDLIFFDGTGLDLPTGAAKKVERLYFGEEFQRAGLDNTGHLEIPLHPLEDYQREFLNSIDQEIIKESGFKIVIDHSNGSSSQIFPTLFTQLGISAVELNASLNPRKFSSSAEENSKAIEQLSSIVKSLKTDIGFILNPAAEKLTVIDELGQPVSSQLLLLIATDLFLQTHQCKKLAVPVNASMGVEEIAKEKNVEVIRVAGDHLSMMQIAMSGEVDFVGGTRGGMIFSGFQKGSDAMLSTVKMLEMIAQTKTSISQIRKKYEHYIMQEAMVPCPWSKKGTVMRQLIINSAEKTREMVDGVRIFEDGGWILITPDRFTASFKIVAETTSVKSTSKLLNRYKKIVEKYQSE
jgi:mannose-1-phosphate guanylyltransferase/phosphomannomutase